MIKSKRSIQPKNSKYTNSMRINKSNVSDIENSDTEINLSKRARTMHIKLPSSTKSTDRGRYLIMLELLQ